jgi:hypothetical protein
MLTPTSGVTQNMPFIHQNKYSKVQRNLSFCNLEKGERGHRKKVYMLKKHRKKQYAPIKEHRKKEKRKHEPPPK